MHAKIRRYITYILLGIAAPALVFASARYYPRDTEHIFLNDLGNDQYEVLVELETGQLFRMDKVVFDGSRYDLFENIARMINSHRYFSRFDDEDVSDLIYGITPFTVAEITDVDTKFTEQELTIIISFGTGDEVRITTELDQRFSSSVEVSQFIADTINQIEELDGSIESSKVTLLHEEPYTGLSYFAPYIEDIVVTYDDGDKNFEVTANFGNEEVRTFDLAYKDTKSQLIQDVTAIINDVYVEYEDAKFVTQDVETKITWEGVPWMIDDIESIAVTPDVALDGTLQFTVRARLSSGLVGVITMNKVFNQDQRDLDLVSLTATEALEENQLFVHDFNVALVYDVLVESLDEDGREFYGISPGGYEEGEEGFGQEEIGEDEEGESEREEIERLLREAFYALFGIHLSEEEMQENDQSELDSVSQETDGAADSTTDNENEATDSSEFDQQDGNEPGAVEEGGVVDQEPNLSGVNNDGLPINETINTIESATEEAMIQILIQLIIQTMADAGMDVDPALFD